MLIIQGRKWHFRQKLDTVRLKKHKLRKEIKIFVYFLSRPFKYVSLYLAHFKGIKKFEYRS